MKILLVAATDLEIEKERFLDFDMLITGIGMLNASISLTKKLSDREYDLIINLGVAGSFNKDVKIGRVVEVVEETISEIGYEENGGFSEFSDFSIETIFSNPSKTDLKKVKSITVNTVHGNENSIDQIMRRLNPDIENMEGAAIFQVCKTFNIPCIQIRAISNYVEKRNKESWNIPLAIQNLNIEVEKLISKL